MRTLVIGANGGIGRIFCDLAAQRDGSVRAMVRSAEQLRDIGARGVEPVVGDLEGEFAHAFEGCDCVVFAAGSGGRTGGDKTLLVDLYGAIRAIEESERRAIRHFVMVSALRADRPLDAPPALRHYMVAKMLADQALEASRIRSTILRPGRLTDDTASGQVRVDPSAPGPSAISRANVAQCIVAALERAPAADRVVDLLDGDTPIEDVFA